MSTTVENLLSNPLLGLEVAAGSAGLWRRVLTSELNRPSLELTGYFRRLSRRAHPGLR